MYKDKDKYKDYQNKYQKEHGARYRRLYKYTIIKDNVFTIRRYPKWLTEMINDPNEHPEDVVMWKELLSKWRMLTVEERVDMLVELNEIQYG